MGAAYSSPGLGVSIWPWDSDEEVEKDLVMWAPERRFVLGASPVERLRVVLNELPWRRGMLETRLELGVRIADCWVRRPRRVLMVLKDAIVFQSVGVGIVGGLSKEPRAAMLSGGGEVRGARYEV